MTVRFRGAAPDPNQEHVMRKSLFLSTLGLIALSATAHADDNQAVEAVIVTATRVPTPQAQIASSITVITAGDIAAKQDRTLSDLLKDVPGLNVVQTGGPGGQTSIFMRGTNSNHTKVLLDGIDVGDPSSANASFDVGQFLTGDVAQVEVLRGPQSGLYGSDAIGGVINIITRSGEGPLTVTGSLEGGSFDTFNQTGTVSGSADGFHYSANIEHFQAGATPVTPLDLLLPGEKRNDDYDDNLTLSTKLGYDVTDNVDVGFVGRYTNTTLHFTGDDFSRPFPLPSFPAATQSAVDTLHYDTRGTAHATLFGGVLDSTLGIAYSSDRTNGIDNTGFSTINAGDRVKIDWQNDIRFAEGEVLVLGAEHARDEISLPISAEQTLNSGYAELQSSLGESFFNTVAVRYDDNDHFGGKVTYRVAPAYLIAETGTKLKASVGTGFKAPTLGDLFQSFPPFFFANPDLKPETSLGYDVGVEQSLLGGNLTGGVTWFHNDIRNLIDGVFLPGGAETLGNVGKAVTDGIESFVAVRPTDDLTIRADYTFTESYDAATHLELLRRPKHKFDLDARWQATTDLSFDATLLHVGSFIDGNRSFTISRLTAPGYTTMNVAASYDLTDQFTLFGRVDNLFDADYQNPTGFLAPGRGFFAGVKAKI
jgi:vitamin B12 transporter